MERWFRIFGSSDVVPDPAQLQGCLNEQATLQFAGDESGWYSAEISQGTSQPLVLERFLVEEEGLRAELNSWACHLETLTNQPRAIALMERTIQTRQLFTLHCPDQAEWGQLPALLSRHLAQLTEGFYQVDDEGFFDSRGELLVRDS